MDSSVCQASTHHENIHHSHPTMVLRSCCVFHRLLLCPFPWYSCAWLNETRACSSTLSQPTQPQHTNTTISHSRLKGSSHHPCNPQQKASSQYGMERGVVCAFSVVKNFRSQS